MAPIHDDSFMQWYITFWSSHRVRKPHREWTFLIGVVRRYRLGIQAHTIIDVHKTSSFNFTAIWRTILATQTSRELESNTSSPKLLDAFSKNVTTNNFGDEVLLSSSRDVCVARMVRQIAVKLNDDVLWTSMIVCTWGLIWTCSERHSIWQDKCIKF